MHILIIPVIVVLHHKVERWPNSEILRNIIEIPLKELKDAVRVKKSAQRNKQETL